MQSFLADSYDRSPIHLSPKYSLCYYGSYQARADSRNYLHPVARMSGSGCARAVHHWLSAASAIQQFVLPSHEEARVVFAGYLSPQLARSRIVVTGYLSSREGRAPASTSQINLLQSAERGRRHAFRNLAVVGKGPRRPPTALSRPVCLSPGSRAVPMHAAKTGGFDAVPHRTATFLSQPRLSIA